MRTQKRFTPDLIDRYRRLGRGSGNDKNYLPWHRVGRGDPASSGRSHLQLWRGRQRELLSDLEWVTFLFATMLKGIIDIREQFPLSLDDCQHELSAQDDQASATRYPGSVSIAADLQVKHPKVHGGGRSIHWVMTTDLLVTLKLPNGQLKLLAIAVKPDRAVDQTRTKELLAIEHAYWEKRGVQWLLVTPKLYDGLVADTLRICFPWAFGSQAKKSQIDFVVESVDKIRGQSLTTALTFLTAQFGSLEVAQRALWQTIWSGRLPIDLRRGWRPHEPLIFMDTADFWSLNPIASGRSIWPC